MTAKHNYTDRLAIGYSLDLEVHWKVISPKKEC